MAMLKREELYAAFLKTKDGEFCAGIVEGISEADGKLSIIWITFNNEDVYAVPANLWETSQEAKNDNLADIFNMIFSKATKALLGGSCWAMSGKDIERAGDEVRGVIGIKKHEKIRDDAQMEVTKALLFTESFINQLASMDLTPRPTTMRPKQPKKEDQP